MKIAYVMFAFNRTKYLKKCLASLKVEIDYCFVDYSDKQDEVIEMLKKFGVKNIIPRAFHHGLANNVITGLTYVFHSDYDAVIIIEEDLLILNNYCFTHIENVLRHNPKHVGSVICQFVWATWKDRWQSCVWTYEDPDENFSGFQDGCLKMYRRAMTGKIDSWGARFLYHQWKSNWIEYNIKEVMVKHIGTFGTNVKFYSNFSVRKAFRKIKKLWQYFSKRIYDTSVQHYDRETIRKWNEL